MDTILSQAGFIVLLSIFALGAVCALIFRNDDKSANLLTTVFSVIGSLFGLLFSGGVLLTQQTFSFSLTNKIMPLWSLTYNIDMLSAFFILVISLVALFCSIYGKGYLKHYYGKYNIGNFGFFYNLFILGMLMVVSSANAVLFLLAWELMSVASYFLVVYDRKDAKNIRAGTLYFAMTHAGTAFIIMAFIVMFAYTGTFEFAGMVGPLGSMPLYIKDIVFVMMLLGFGAKAGIIPLHIWLPAAHPAAPSHVSALMSGVMIKMGIYMMMRMFLGVLGTGPLWWGELVLAVGAVSSLLGVLYALTEHDIKRLLAYHSIENIGIILLGLGSAMMFGSLGMPALAVVGVIAALFHTVNHAVFKSLLFLSAGSVINSVHTKNIENYGGLLKYMPVTGLAFLIGSMAISGLPPFNGFFSEWITFQSLFQGMMVGADMSSKGLFVLAGGALAFTSGLALACFVKAFGATFLARPRTEAVKSAKEADMTMKFGMMALAAVCLVLGVFSGFVTGVLGVVAKVFPSLNVSASAVAGDSLNGMTVNNFGFVSGPAIFAALILMLVIVVAIVKYTIYRKQNIIVGNTWDCGVDLKPRMEITATGFSQTIIRIFKGILKPTRQAEFEYHDAHSRYFPKSRTILLGIADVYQKYIYRPLYIFVVRVSEACKKVQNGNINAYISYIFLALLIILVISLKL